jgi:hypothetical protein
VEFKLDVVENATARGLSIPAVPTEADRVLYHYFQSWDIGLAHDSTVGLCWRIPKSGVTIHNKVRVVDADEVKGGDDQTLDHIATAIRVKQALYRGQSAVDASGLGGVAAFRQVKEMRPSPLAFVSRANHRIYGNMRLAAITNGIDMLTWGRPDLTPEQSGIDMPWGLVEIPYIAMLADQLANFDRDAKDVPDDWVWSFLIGLWYIRRYWVVGQKPAPAQRFDPRSRASAGERRRPYSLKRR